MATASPCALGSAWQVGIEGDVDGGVAEELLHVLVMHALYEQRYAGVPKIRTPTEQEAAARESI